MNSRTLLAAVLLTASPALAQPAVDWFTIDCGGGQSQNGSLSVMGTIAQPDVGEMSGGPFSISGGFWTPAGAPACVADTDDGSGTGSPDGGVTIDDLLFYLGIFAAGDIRADVDDGSATGARDGGVTIDDLLYFLTRFAAGC